MIGRLVDLRVTLLFLCLAPLGSDFKRSRDWMNIGNKKRRRRGKVRECVPSDEYISLLSLLKLDRVQQRYCYHGSEERCLLRLMEVSDEMFPV